MSLDFHLLPTQLIQSNKKINTYIIENYPPCQGLNFKALGPKGIDSPLSQGTSFKILKHWILEY